MAQLTQRGKFVWRVQLRTHKPFSLTLHCKKADAETVRRFLCRLEHLRTAGLSPSGDLLEWARGVGPEIKQLLVDSGLVNLGFAGGTLDDLIAHAERVCSHLAHRTKTNHAQYHRSLREFFGGSRSIVTITPGDCDQFCRWLSEEPQSYGPASVQKRIKHSRQIFGYAVRHEWIARNPFAGIRVKVQIDLDRRHYVTKEDTERVLSMLRSDEDKLVFALARYAGFRCGSEVRSLRWCDIDWDTMTMRVWADKTKTYRVCPIFVELQKYLRPEMEGDDEFVCPNFRSASDQFYRKKLERAIVRAGLEVWPDLLLNCRRSRATEIVEMFGVKAESDWIGHGPDISKRHYQMTLKEKIELAVGRSNLNFK